MKLLLDENLSPKLTRSLADLFPGSAHVEECQLSAADDGKIWSFAKEEDFTIVSKDSDSYDRSSLYGSPPKVVWLRVGNSTTAEIETLLERSKPAIDAFANSRENDPHNCSGHSRNQPQPIGLHDVG